MNLIKSLKFRYHLWRVGRLTKKIERNFEEMRQRHSDLKEAVERHMRRAKELMEELEGSV